MAFVNAQMVKLLRNAREKFYDDILVMHVMSGVKDTGAPEQWTLPGGATVNDAWSRTNTDPTRQAVVTQKILLSGNFTWLPAADRSFVQVGMFEGAEAAFSCSDEFYPVVSGARMWSVVDGTQLRIIRISLANNTGEMVLVLGKTRDDF
jgi:hypothetical protein